MPSKLIESIELRWYYTLVIPAPGNLVELAPGNENREKYHKDIEPRIRGVEIGHFFDATFPRLEGEERINTIENLQIQQHLLGDLRAIAASGNEAALFDAFSSTEKAICLRCYISHVFFEACWYRMEEAKKLLKSLNKETLSLDLRDLFACVLDDDGRAYSSPELLRSRATYPYSFKTLKGYLEKTSELKQDLKGWFSRQVRWNDDIKNLLRKSGLSSRTAWSYLKDIKERGLKRIYQDFHNLRGFQAVISSKETKKHCYLLNSFQWIYKRDHNLGNTCHLPTEAQQHEIIFHLREKVINYLDKEVISYLQEMISHLRQEHDSSLIPKPVNEIIEELRRSLTPKLPKEITEELNANNPKSLKAIIHKLEEVLKELKEITEELSAITPEQLIDTLKIIGERIRHYDLYHVADLPDVRLSQECEDPPLPIHSDEKSLLEVIQENLEKFIDKEIEKSFSLVLAEFQKKRFRNLAPHIKPALHLLFCKKFSEKEVEASIPELSQSQISRRIKPFTDDLYREVEKRVKRQCKDYCVNHLSGVSKNPKNIQEIVEFIDEKLDGSFFEEYIFSSSEGKLGKSKKERDSRKGRYIDRLRHYLKQSQE